MRADAIIHGVWRFGVSSIDSHIDDFSLRARSFTIVVVLPTFLGG
jgi:hypothetical protein